MRTLLITLVLAGTGGCIENDSDLDINPVVGTIDQIQISFADFPTPEGAVAAAGLRDDIMALFRKHQAANISRYLFKTKFHLDAAPSFSGATRDEPITISTYYAPRPGATAAANTERLDRLLLLLLHEESHWARENWDAPIAWAKENYRKDLVAAGSRDGWQTDVHVTVNWMELQAGKALLGADRTYQLICTDSVYPQIYKRVVADEAAIGAYVASQRLNVEPVAAVMARTCP